jgi:hypothetical protein
MVEHVGEAPLSVNVASDLNGDGIVGELVNEDLGHMTVQKSVRVFGRRARVRAEVFKVFNVACSPPRP